MAEAGRTDQELLRGYATGDRAAFEELFRRHRALVYSVCLRRLRNAADAEDAAAAAFVVLSRKASSLSRKNGKLSVWLYRCALNTARNAARQRARRQAREAESAKMIERMRSSRDRSTWQEVLPHLDAALAALPAQQQEAVILHYMQGRTLGETAAEIGCPEGTVASRTRLALEHLRRRLGRFAPSLSLAAVAAGLTASVTEPLVPEALTAKVLAVAAGSSLPAGVSAIASGTLKTLAWAKIKMAAAALAVSAVLAGGGALMVRAAIDDDRESPGLNAALLDMPDNSWLQLKPDRNPRSRAFSGCCFGAGKLWYFGGGHYSWKGNDVEIFDPRANRWNRLTDPEWPGEDTPAWRELTSGGDGTAELSPSGRPYTEHSFQQVCWDPRAGRFVAVLRNSGAWEFDPAGASWSRLASTVPGMDRGAPGAIGNLLVIYDPGLGVPVAVLTARKRDSIFALNADRRGWRSLGGVPPELAGGSCYATYVPEWKGHLLSCSGGKTGGGWYRLNLEPPAISAVSSADGPAPSAALACDAANRVCIVLEKRATAGRTFTVRPWALDVATGKWSQPTPGGAVPASTVSGQWAPLWYDSDHKVFLFLNNVNHGTRYEGGTTQTWAYRYKQSN